MLDINVRNIIFIVLLLLLMYFCLLLVNETTVQEGAKFNLKKFVKKQAAIVKRKAVNTVKTISKTPVGRQIVKAANVVQKKAAPIVKVIRKKIPPVKIKIPPIRRPPPIRLPPPPKFDGISKMLQHMNTLPFFAGVSAAQAAALTAAGIVKLTDINEKNINAKQAEIQAAYQEISKYIGSWQDYLAYLNDKSVSRFFQGSWKIVIANLKIVQETFKIDTKNRDELRRFIILLYSYGLSLDQAKEIVSSYNLKSIFELDVIYNKIKLTGLTKPTLPAFLQSANKKFQVPLNADKGYEDMTYFIKVLAYYGITDYSKYRSFSSAFLSAMSINYQDFITMYDINIHYGVVIPSMSRFMQYVFSMRGACDMACSEVKGNYNLSSQFLTQYEKTICKLRGFGATNTDVYLYAMGRIPFRPFSDATSPDKECYINTFKQYGINKIEQIKVNGGRLHSSFPNITANILDTNDYSRFGMTPQDNLFDFINKLNEIKVSVQTYPIYRSKISSMFGVNYPIYNQFHALLMQIQYYWTNTNDFDIFVNDVNTFNNGTANQNIAKLEFFVSEINKFGLATYIDYRNFMDFMNANVNITNINLKQLIDKLNQFGVGKSADAIELVNALKEPMLKLNLNKSKPFSSFLDRLMALGVKATNLSSANVVDLITNDGTTFNKSLRMQPNLTPREPQPIPDKVSITTNIPMNEGFAGIGFDIYSMLGSLTGSSIFREGLNEGVLERLKSYGAISMDNICQDENGDIVGWEKFSDKMAEFGILPSSYAINKTIMVLEIFKADFGVSLPTIYPTLNIAIKFGINVDNLKQFSADIRASLLNNGKMTGNDFEVLLRKWVDFDVRYVMGEKNGDYKSLLTAGRQFGWNAKYISSREAYYRVFDVLKPYGITHRRHLNDTRFSIFVHNMTSILKMDIEKFSTITSLLTTLNSLDETARGTPTLNSAAHNMRDVITPMPNFTYKVDTLGKTCIQSNTCDGAEEATLVNLMLKSTQNVFTPALLVPFLLKEEYEMLKQGNIKELIAYFKQKYGMSETQSVYRFIKNLSDAFYRKIEADKNTGVYANYVLYLNTYNIVRFFPYATFSILAGDVFESDQYDDIQNVANLYVNSEARRDNSSPNSGIVSYESFVPMGQQRQLNYRSDNEYQTMLNMSSSLWKAYTPFTK